MRRSSSRSALIGACFLALAGCQLITGSYHVDTMSLGPICTQLSLCCFALPGDQSTECETLVTDENEEVCATYLIGLPGEGCLSQPDSGFIILPKVDARGSGSDVFQGNDAMVGTEDSSSPLDADSDASSGEP